MSVCLKSSAPQRNSCPARAKLGALGTTAGFKAAGFKLPLDASSARPGTQPESGDQLTTANRVHYAQGKPGTLDGQIRLAAEKRASEALAARREQEAADMLLRDKQTQAKPRETSEETWPVYQETRLLGEMNWRLNQRLDLLKHGEYALAEDFRADMRSLLSKAELETLSRLSTPMVQLKSRLLKLVTRLLESNSKTPPAERRRSSTWPPTPLISAYFNEMSPIILHGLVLGRPVKDTVSLSMLNHKVRGM